MRGVQPSHFFKQTQQCRLRPHVQGDLMAPLKFQHAGAQGGPTVAVDPSSVPISPSAAPKFDANQEAGAALGKVEKKGGYRATYRPAQAHC